MSVITHVPEANTWDVICKEFASKRPPFRDDDDISVHTTLEDYDPSIMTPVLYGGMYDKVKVDADASLEFDPAISHPACVGYTFVDRPITSPPPPPTPPPHKDKFLLPALEQMLQQAKKEKCFERKRTKFDALDFLTQYLYSHNPQHENREDIELGEIPFVKEWWKDHPRPPLPMSLLWSDEEAALIVQSFWRGYKVRLDPEIQELRLWQKEWREEKEDINEKVDEFWAKNMPNGDKSSPCTSQEQISGAEEISAQ